MTEFVTTVEYSEVSTISLQYEFVQRKINDLPCFDMMIMIYFDEKAMLRHDNNDNIYMHDV